MNEWKKRRLLKQQRPHPIGSLVWWNPDAFLDDDLAQLIVKFGMKPFEVYNYVEEVVIVISDSAGYITSHHSHFKCASSM